MERTENRRRFFRITDVVDLSYRVIDERDAAESSCITSQILTVCSLAGALESLTQESAKLLHRIEKKQPELVSYLKLLNEKIDLLALAILEDRQGDNANSRKVNVSASGLAFQCAEAIDPGLLIEIKMMMTTFRVVLVVCCKVVHCAKIHHAEGAAPCFMISADFNNLTEADQDILMQHLVRRQMQQLREKGGKH
ncbi:MAG: PilZ domain-containing protein [Gammaproteobacteria bacterium]